MRVDECSFIQNGKRVKRPDVILCYPTETEKMTNLKDGANIPNSTTKDLLNCKFEPFDDYVKYK